MILQARGLRKTFQSGSEEITILDGVDLSIPEGGACAIVGPSGSGKTTLLGLCAGLDKATAGEVILGKEKLFELSENQRAAVRRQSVGFVFQNFQLLPSLTALENVATPLELEGKRETRERAREILNRVGLGKRLQHYPLQLSGGEQQRVAIARAFVNQPDILFADEPTGNLDAESSERIVEMMFELNAESNTAIMMVTHDLDLAQRTGAAYRMQSGKLTPAPSTSQT